jgi:hypothetical protein
MVARILGVSKWGGPISAYLELVEGTEAPRNSAMGRGKLLEATVLSLWAERDGMFLVPGERKVQPSGMFYAHATLDALAVLALEDGALVIPEAKTLAVEQSAGWGHDGSDLVATEYHLQAIWYLGVCRAAGWEVEPEVPMPTLVGPEAELAWAARMAERLGRPLTFADLEGSNLELRVYRIPWDAEIFAVVDARVRAFIDTHVWPRVPPAPSEGDVLMERDLHAIARGFKGERGRALDFEKLAPVAKTVFHELLEATRQRRAWEEVEEQAKARVQLLLGSAEEVRGLPDGARVLWKTNKAGSRRFEVKEPRS